MMNFNELNLIAPILQALETEGYTQPTPIQEQAIPIVLSQKDLLGCAQTGTGKTAAFTIPILQLMHVQQQASKQSYHKITALILTPTRELAIQIGEERVCVESVVTNVLPGAAMELLRAALRRHGDHAAG